jgi:hypothetical protein
LLRLITRENSIVGMMDLGSPRIFVTYGKIDLVHQYNKVNNVYINNTGTRLLLLL